VSDTGTRPPTSTDRIFRRLRALIGCYIGLSALTLAVAFALRHDAANVDAAVWIRGSLVVIASVVMLALAARAAAGSRRAYLRLRVISLAMVLAIVVIVALPGTFPLWMKIEQCACGLLLLGVVATLNGRDLRAVFARK